MSVLIISGSPSRQPSRSAALLDHASLRLRAASVPIESVGIHDIPADDLVFARRDGQAAAMLDAMVARSQAIVIGAPVYNAAIPGGLKALLDLLPQKALQGKPVLPVASGGSAGHQLAIEYSLKPILSALGARHVLAGVFACEGDVQWLSGPTAAPRLVPALAERLDDAIDALLALLVNRVSTPAITSLFGAPVTAIGRFGPVGTPDPAITSTPERCSA